MTARIEQPGRTRRCFRVTGFVSAWYMEGMILLAITLIVGVVAYNGYRDYGIKKNMAEALAIGQQLTRLLDAYLKQHREFPDAIRQLGPPVTSPVVKDIRLNKSAKTVAVVIAFAPVEDKSIVFTARPGPGEIRWDCAGRDIPEMYLPGTCRH